MAGFNPAIHLAACTMDGRVKPGHDREFWFFIFLPFAHFGHDLEQFR
jgi:hypothetical protein